MLAVEIYIERTWKEISTPLIDKLSSQQVHRYMHFEDALCQAASLMYRQFSMGASRRADSGKEFVMVKQARVRCL